MVLRQGIASVAILFIGLTVGIVGSVLFFKAINKTTNSNIVSQTPSNQTDVFDDYNYKVKGNCTNYGKIEDKDELYKKYIVKSGDTLLLVAKKELGDTSRVSDIVYINEKDYPGLSIKNPYIEPGWVLHLPPPYFKSLEFSGDIPKLLFGWAGELVAVTNDGRWIVRGTNPNHNYGFQPDKNSQFFGKQKNEFVPGDCVKAVIKEYDLTVLAVYKE